MRDERIGEIFILGQVAIFGFFPIIASDISRLMPPVLFMAISTLIAAVCTGVYLLWKREFKGLANPRALIYMLGAALFIATIPQIFIILGASKTSSINVAILWQTEMLFTFIICGGFYDDHVTLRKVLAAMFIVIGATAVLYNGSFHINLGDLFIIAGTFFFPFGNIFTKKAFPLSTPSVILFVRSMIGGVALLAFSLAFEKYDHSIINYTQLHLYPLLINGIIISFISKLIWYRGLVHLEITKAIALTLSGPGFTLIYAFALNHEVPTMYQLAGLVVIIAGLFVLIQKSALPRSVPPPYAV